MEKIFGVEGLSPNIILRNWLTFNLRHCIAEQESIAYHNKKGKQNIHDIKINFNHKIKSDLMEKHHIYKNLGRSDYFKKNFAAENYLLTWENNCWQVLTLFPQ